MKHRGAGDRWLTGVPNKERNGKPGPKKPDIPPDERWLEAQVRNAETLDEAKLAVSVFLVGRRRLKILPFVAECKSPSGNRAVVVNDVIP